MTAEHPITDKHEIARLLALDKGEQAQVVHLATVVKDGAVTPLNPKAMEDMRKYLEESIPGLEWVNRKECIYRRPK